MATIPPIQSQSQPTMTPFAVALAEFIRTTSPKQNQLALTLHRLLGHGMGGACAACRLLASGLAAEVVQAAVVERAGRVERRCPTCEGGPYFVETRGDQYGPGERREDCPCCGGAGTIGLLHALSCEQCARELTDEEIGGMVREAL